jgi:hypothetical protein
MFGVIEDRRAGADEKMRDFLLIDVFDDGHVGGGAHGVDEKQHLLAFDQASDLLHRLGRAVGVVQTDEVDLAAVHATLFVDHREIRGR